MYKLSSTTKKRGYLGIALSDMCSLIAAIDTVRPKPKFYDPGTFGGFGKQVTDMHTRFMFYK